MEKLKDDTGGKSRDPAEYELKKIGLKRIKV